MRDLVKFKIIFTLQFFLIILASCRLEPQIKPEVICATTQHITLSALCVKALSVNLGPVDEFVGYTPISNLNVLLLAQGAIAANDEGDLQQPSAETLQKLGEGAEATDEEGNLTLFIEPGEYVLCVFRILANIFPEKLAYCEQISIAPGGATEVLVYYNPRGGFITFE